MSVFSKDRKKRCMLIPGKYCLVKGCLATKYRDLSLSKPGVTVLPEGGWGIRLLRDDSNDFKGMLRPE